MVRSCATSSTYAPVRGMTTMPLLLVRPLADARRLAAALGVEAVISPLLEVVVTGRPPPAQAVIFTSSNAVEATS